MSYLCVYSIRMPCQKMSYLFVYSISMPCQQNELLVRVFDKYALSTK